MKIASWNVNSLNVRLPHLEQWLAAARPDVVALQETKLEDPRFPFDELQALGYASVFHGQKTYNGVALLSRNAAIHQVQMGIPGFEDDQRRVIAATIGDWVGSGGSFAVDAARHAAYQRVRAARRSLLSGPLREAFGTLAALQNDLETH